jgi:hypothetical protein
MSKTVLGIHVAKSKLDVALMLNSKVLMKKFDNTIKGFKLLQGWLGIPEDRAGPCLSRSDWAIW